MAYIPRELPVLTGKAARDFYKKVAEFKDDTSKEEVQECNRRFRKFMSEQTHLHRPW
jgi:hypothetical protein